MVKGGKLREKEVEDGLNCGLCWCPRGDIVGKVDVDGRHGQNTCVGR